ncbi:MAG: site-specific integrase [Desulfatiglans sp.]|nr:site-specific integrase [Desulfatiglans sp.]
MQREKRETLKKQSEKESVTFSEFYNNSYLPLLGNKAPGSVHAEKILFTKWIKPYIGNMPFKDIFPLHIEKIKKAMTDLKKAPRSIEYVFSTARQIWNQAKRDGLTDRDSPTKQVKKPKYDNKRTTFFTHEQADILLEKLKEKSTQVYHISLLSLHTGMRASEIFKLKWVDLNLEEGIINIKDAKSGSRPAFMTSEVKAMFEKIKSQNNFFNDLVFTSNAGDTIRQISKTFERVIDELGFNEGITDRRQRFTFHNLRHTYASWLVQQGTPLYTVQQLMGHKSIALTERYSHLAPDSLKAAVTAFEKNLRLKKQAKVKIIKLEK